MNKLHQWKFGPNGYQCQQCGVIWREVDGRPANGDCPNAALAEPPSEGYPPLPEELRTMRELGRVAGPDTVERLMRAYVDLHMLEETKDDDALQPCGHPKSLALQSAESGEPLYCEACDDKSGRRDAELRESELAAANVALRERIAELEAQRVPRETLQAIQLAYGHLWHVNADPAAPVPLYSPEKAAYQARRYLRDLLTVEQRGEGINQAGVLLGRYAAHVAEPQKIEGGTP